jgi:putative ABC transport system ATP-binding protein
MPQTQHTQLTQATSPTADDIARVVGATKVYGAGTTAVTALDNVTIGFERACFTAIMGPSGSGKSTLLHCPTAS